MPRLRSPDNTARRYLFRVSMAQIVRNTGICHGTAYNRRKHPGDITLDELAQLVRENELDAEELYKVVTERG